MSVKIKPCPICYGNDITIDAGRDFAIKCTDCWSIRIAAPSKELAIQRWNNLRCKDKDSCN